MQDGNSILNALHERRSIRKYTDEPVSTESIKTILDAGRWAPSGLNNQPWRFLVVQKGDPRMEKLADCTKYEVLRDAGSLCG